MADFNDRPFGGKGSDEYNTLWIAIHRCGQDYAEYALLRNEEGISESEFAKCCLYEWMESTPRTTHVVQVVDKLREMGFKITEVSNG